MKFCYGCETNKDSKQFYTDVSSRDGLNSYCKDCAKQKCNDRYKNNSGYREKALARKTKRRETIKKFLFDYLQTHHCVDCPESDPRCLEFDHVRGEKEFHLADATQILPSLERIQKELDKCDVRCANCHRKKTAKDFNHYTHILLVQKETYEDNR